jgi:hypothetical protein
MVTVTWDMWLRQQVGKGRREWQRRRQRIPDQVQSREESVALPVELTAQDANNRSQDGVQRRNIAQIGQSEHGAVGETTPQMVDAPLQTPETDTKSHAIPVLTGICIIVAFFGMDF